MTEHWQFWIDRGGTFTDIVARHPDGHLTSHKYLSANPERYTDAAVFGMRDIIGVAEDAPFPSDRVETIKMGTTVATNALLERAGSKTALVITAGLRDALLIGQQHRSDLFALVPSRPAPLYDRVIEAGERLDANGGVVTPLDEDALRTALISAKDAGCEAVAVALAHSYKNPAHEQRVAEIAADVGFTQISLSHDMSATIKLAPRGDTAVADAYLSPTLRRYVDLVSTATGGVPLYFMQSSGGLAAASAFHGRHAILSGPAGGIVGAAATGARAGKTNLIGFDMGGTSTDVSHYSGTYERTTETVIAGVRFSVPMMDIHTVAAGGGSVCDILDGRLTVGPRSAGADPGPASYGRGGPVAVTDCNVVLGKIQPHLFPAVFGADGDKPLDVDAARAGLAALADTLAAHGGARLRVEALAEGFLAVAVEHMARAIKRVSVERGHNIKDYALLTFGGAGGQHACLVADALSMRAVLVPPFAGVLSGLGMGLAQQQVILEESAACGLEDKTAIQTIAEKLRGDAVAALVGQGVDAADIHTDSFAHIKVKGSDTPLAVPLGSAEAMETAFAQDHIQQFGFAPEGTLLVHSISLEAAGGGDSDALAGLSVTGEQTTPAGHVQAYLAGSRQSVPVFNRDSLKPGVTITGPAIITEDGSTTLVEPGWQFLRQTDGALLLERVEAARAASTTEVDPILLEVFNNLFMSVAEEMGGVLAKTAHSVNVKERLDFSCAVFDTGGGLVANAPHMPVHLGSMGTSVKAIVEARGDTICEGDVFAVNDPFAGGTHLPDITVISPVFLEGDTPDYFVASRGHHADIGGTAPGSMPPFSTRIEEEGARFINEHIVIGGKFQEARIRAVLGAGPYPARLPDQNIADLKAQIAANARGIRQIKALTDRFGRDTVSAYMGHVKANARDAVARLITHLKDGHCRYPMDCGGWIDVDLRIDRDRHRAVVDFSNTAPQLDGNFNAPLAVTRAAVLYVFRLLTATDIPLNDGCLEPVEIIVPEGSMLNPREGAAVVAGNVEVSQAIVNALLLASGAAAASQGTMNNFIFGDDRRQYYETIAGGTGASADASGADAIHSHMTNSRLTDIEVLEHRYPVRVAEFSVRAGSGGRGKHTGGNGLVRDIVFLEPMSVSILAGHRDFGPPGCAGGEPGAAGQNLHIDTHGTVRTLRPSDAVDVAPGERIRLETPGGGGFGKAGEA